MGAQVSTGLGGGALGGDLQRIDQVVVDAGLLVGQGRHGRG